MRRRPLPHEIPGSSSRHEVPAWLANQLLEDVIVGFSITHGEFLRVEVPWGELPVVEAFGIRYALSGYLGTRGHLYALGDWTAAAMRVSDGDLVDGRTNRVLGRALEIAAYIRKGKRKHAKDQPGATARDDRAGLHPPGARAHGRRQTTGGVPTDDAAPSLLP